MQLRCRRILLDAQQAGYLLMALFLNDIQVEYGPIAIRQPAYHVSDDISRYVMYVGWVGRCTVECRIIRDCPGIGEDLCFFLFFTKEAKGMVYDYAC